MIGEAPVERRPLERRLRIRRIRVGCIETGRSSEEQLIAFVDAMRREMRCTAVVNISPKFRARERCMKRKSGEQPADARNDGAHGSSSWSARTFSRNRTH